MAEAYGNIVQHWRVKVVAWIKEQTGDTATIVCETYWQSLSWGYQVYGHGSATVSGQSSTTGTYNFTSPSRSSVTKFVTSKEVRVNKGYSPYNVSVSGSVTFTGGYHNGTSTASFTIQVPARTYIKHGEPSFSVSPSVVGVNEKAHLTWGKAAVQGNANFDHFEVWENHKKIYSGGATSLDVIPSNVPDLDNVLYEVAEVHEWYGTYPQTLASQTVNVIRLAQPGQPRTVSPQNGSTVPYGRTIRLQWVHNSIDRTAQELAEIELYDDSSTQSFRTFTVNGSNQYIDIQAPSTITSMSKWRVRTKGKHPDKSEWSDFSYFRLALQPVVTITPIEKITMFPLTVTWSFSDTGTNSQTAWKLDVSQGQKRFTLQGNNSNNKATIQGTEIEFNNTANVNFVLTLTSTTGLTSTATASARIEYLAPAQPALTVVVDDYTLTNKVYVNAGTDSEAAPTIGIDLYRDDILLGEDMHSGDFVVDATVPLDKPLTYRAIAKAGSGSINNTTQREYVQSKNRVAVNFGDNFEKVLLIGLESEPNLKFEKEKELFESAAYAAPVAIYGTHKQASGDISANIHYDTENFGTKEAALELLEWNNACLVRLPVYGYVYNADVELEINSYDDNYLELSLDWKEIAGNGSSI